jgi:hypothetical protein
MAKGRKTGGRKKGSKNKRTLAIEKAAGGMLPLDYMLSVMRNSKADLRRRDEMARATAPYVHSRKPTMAELGTKDAAAGPCHYHLPQLQ